MSVEQLQPSELPERPSGSTAVPVSAILPAGYEVYLRLFHPFVDWDSAAGEPVEHRATWQQIAGEAGVPFGPQLTWRQLRSALREGNRFRYQLPTGELTPGTAAALVVALRRTSGDEQVYFDYGLAAIIAGMEAASFRAPLDEFEEVRKLVAEQNGGMSVAGPECIWPENRRWVVFTDYDLSSTYIAADETTARAIENHPDLETIRASLDTRIDDDADLAAH